MTTLLAVALALPAIAAFVLATRRRFPSAALPLTFALLMGQAIALMPIAQHGGGEIAIDGVGLVLALAALGMALATAESQLPPGWWARFERDLRAYEALQRA